MSNQTASTATYSPFDTVGKRATQGAFMAFETHVYHVPSITGKISGGVTAQELLSPSRLAQRLMPGCAHPSDWSDFKMVGGRARRPLSGITFKDNMRPAAIEVVSTQSAPNGPQNRLKILGSSGGKLTGKTARYTDFILTQVTEQRAEKVQIVDTFGEPFVFMFGERPRILQVSGVLLNTQDFNWRALWWENYDKYLRGSKCAENRAMVQLSWDDIVVKGYIMMSMVNEGAPNAKSAFGNSLVQFSFTFLISQYMNTSSKLFAEEQKNYIQARPVESAGALSEEVYDMMTGRAVLISEGMREWFASRKARSYSDLALAFLHDPLGTTQNFLGNVAFGMFQRPPTEWAEMGAIAAGEAAEARDPCGTKFGIASLMKFGPLSDEKLDKNVLSKDNMKQLTGAPPPIDAQSGVTSETAASVSTEQAVEGGNLNSAGFYPRGDKSSNPASDTSDQFNGQAIVSSSLPIA